MSFCAPLWSVLAKRPWRIHSSRRATESSSFSLETCARRTARSLNCRSSSAFSAMRRLSSFSRKPFLALGRGQLALGLLDLHGQIRDGGAEINGLLVQRLILRLQLGDLGVAFGRFLLAGLERGLGLGKIIGNLGEGGQGLHVIVGQRIEVLDALFPVACTVGVHVFLLIKLVVGLHQVVRQRAVGLGRSCCCSSACFLMAMSAMPSPTHIRAPTVRQ